MATHVALLRGINVGKSTRIPMPALRDLLTDLGHHDVATYVQSGNVVLTPAPGSGSATALATKISDAVHETFGVRSHVVVLTATQWHKVVSDNPYPDEPEPRYVHAAVQQSPVTKAQRAALETLLDQVQEQGHPDELAVAGRVTYLHTPNGLGRSPLADRLARTKGAAQDRATARNWRTVLAIDDLLREERS